MTFLSPRAGVLALVLSAGFLSQAAAQTSAPSQLPPDATVHTDAKGRHLAPHDTFYMLDYVSARTDKGVEGFTPGTEVHLVAVHRDSHMLVVSDGHADVEVPPSKLTNDLDIAALVKAKDDANQARVAAYQQAEERAYEDFQRAAADYSAKDLEMRQQEQKDAQVRALAQANASQTPPPVQASVANNGYYNEGGYGYGSPYGYFTNVAVNPATNTAGQATPSGQTTNAAQSTGGQKAAIGASETGSGRGTVPTTQPAAGGKKP